MGLKSINKKEKSLSTNDLCRLQVLFQNKGWPIISAFDNSLFDNFCGLLAGLDCDQRALMLALTEKFIWIKESDYLKLFENVFEIFVNEFLSERGEKVIICPLLSDPGKVSVKSSTFLFYLIKSKRRSIQEKYQEFDIGLADSPASFNMKCLCEGKTLCLIDDFIGTGRSAQTAVDYYVSRGISLKDIGVVSLIGMKKAICHLRNGGYNVYSAIECDKGISDSNNAEQNIRIMKTIEDNIRVKEEYRMGYGQSESLVSMIRTPNNTFPIYWERKNNRFAPFPR